MSTLGTALTFHTPDWAILLGLGGAAALIVEAMSLVLWAGRGRKLRGALLRGSSFLLLGPVIAIAGMLRLGITGSATRARKWIFAGVWSTTLWVLTALLVLTGSTGAILVLGTCGIFWIVRSYAQGTTPVPRRGKVLLGLLRMIVLVLLVLWGLHPTLVYQVDRRIRKVLLVGVDTSASMQRKDQPIPRTEPPLFVTRIDAVRNILQSYHSSFRRLSDKGDVAFFTFPGSTIPAEESDIDKGLKQVLAAEPTGQFTAIGDAAAEIFDRYLSDQREVAAIVLITDGCNNTSDVIDPEKFASLMNSRSVPIHTVTVGSSEISRSAQLLLVGGLRAPDQVQRFNRFPIEATVRATNLKGQKVRLTCEFGETIVSEQELVIDNPRYEHVFRDVHVPLDSGFNRLTVSVHPVDPAARDFPGRHTTDRLVHVVDRELRVLYVEGKLRYESKYITQGLVGAERFLVDRRILLQPGSSKGALSLGESPEAWLPYHVIIFGDVGAEHFTDRQLEIVRELVGQYGKGFCMIGGTRSFGRGGWSHTAIADLLPVEVETSRAQIDEKIKVIPTAEGLRSRIMRIADDDTDVKAAWEKLPELSGANRLSGVKPAATVLARSRKGDPLIVAQQYGKGRSVGIAFDSTWRWVLTEQDTGELQKRFWRQVMLYLGQPKGHVWIATDQTRYDRRRLGSGADFVEVTAGIEDPSGKPLTDVPIEVELTGPNNLQRALELHVDGPVRRIELHELTAPGVYTLRINAELNDNELSAQQQFEVTARDLEAQDLSANVPLLKRISQISKGMFVELPEFGKLLRRIGADDLPPLRRVTVQQDLSTGGRWWVVLGLISLLCAEWILRKRRGLV